MNEKSTVHIAVSERLQNTPLAIIDVLIEKHPNVKFNLAPGSPDAVPNPKALETCRSYLSNPAKVTEFSRYDDVIGKHALRKRWTNYIFRSSVDGRDDKDMEELMPDHELMITAGANQAFFNMILATCDVNDDVVVVLPYYFSHVNALVMNGISPIFVPVPSQTLLPNMCDVIEAITPTTKAIVISNPGNPSGVVMPQVLLDELSDLCKERKIYLCLDEAYREYDFSDNESPKTAYTPKFHEFMIKLYTMSKVFGMAGWRIGGIIYPKPLTIEMRKVQDTIPTHASLFSQAVALEALHYKPSHMACAFRVREIFLSVILPVYLEFDMADLFVHPTGAFYLFLPYKRPKEEGATLIGYEDDKVVDSLACTFDVLTTPGYAFGMAGYVRVCYGAISEGEATEAAHCLGKGMRHHLELHDT